MASKITLYKFGGTSINSEEKLDNAYRLISDAKERREKVVSVVSAFRGATDLLQKTSWSPQEEVFKKKWGEIHGDCSLHLTEEYREKFEEALHEKIKYLQVYKESPWARDDLLAQGEAYSTQIFANYLQEKGLRIKTKYFDRPEYPIIAYGDFGSARINLELTREVCKNTLLKDLDDVDCIVCPGIGGVSPFDGRIRIRRGASDYVATSLSYALKSNALWILSDVHGIKTANSSIIVEAETIPSLTVEELLDAGALGAKNTNTAFFLPLTQHCPQETYFAKYDDPKGEKTRIQTETDKNNGKPVKLVAGREILLFTFEGYDIEREVLNLEEKLAEKYDFIRGGGFNRERYLAFFDLDQEHKITRDVYAQMNGMKVTSSRMGLVGIVGEGMKKTKRIMERMGRSLGDINIVYAIDISKISAGVIIDVSEVEKAIERLYTNFIVREA